MNREEVLREYDEYDRMGRIWGQVSVDRITKICFPRTSRDTIERYLALPELTTTVSDILDRHGIRGAVSASRLSPLLPGRKIAGNAVTLRSIPERKSPTKGYIDKAPINMSTRDIYSLAEPGDVFVADFAGDIDTSNFGGQSGIAAQMHGIAGAIVYGAVRDASTLRETGYPVWAAGVTPISGKYRMEAMEINGPVRIHDIVVQSGDLVTADDSGICVIPADLVDSVIDEASKISQKEDKVRSLLKSGASVSTLKTLYRS